MKLIIPLQALQVDHDFFFLHNVSTYIYIYLTAQGNLYHNFYAILRQKFRNAKWHVQRDIECQLNSRFVYILLKKITWWHVERGTECESTWNFK